MPDQDPDEAARTLQEMRDRQRAGLGLPPANYGPNIRPPAEANSSLGGWTQSPPAGASPGPGWWQASDGRWYPPETHPNYVPPPASSLPPPSFPPPAPSSKRPQSKRTTYIIAWSIGILVALVALAVILGDTSEDSAKEKPTSADGADVTDPVEATAPAAGQQIVIWYGTNADAFDDLATSLLAVSDAALTGDLDALGPTCVEARSVPGRINRDVPDAEVRTALDTYLGVVEQAMSACVEGAQSNDVDALERSAALTGAMNAAFDSFSEVVLRKTGRG